MKEWLELGNMQERMTPSKKQEKDFLNGPVKNLEKTARHILSPKEKLWTIFSFTRHEKRRLTDQDLSIAEFCSDYLETTSLGIIVPQVNKTRDAIKINPGFSLYLDFATGIYEINQRFRNSVKDLNKGPLFTQNKIDEISKNTERDILTNAKPGHSTAVVLAGVRYGHLFYKTLYTTLAS